MKQPNEIQKFQALQKKFRAHYVSIIAHGMKKDQYEYFSFSFSL